MPEILWNSKFEIKPNKWVFVQSAEHKKRGSALVSSLSRRWSPPEFYYHFREGGHVAALKSHKRHQYFFYIDIRDFFGSINRTRVTRVLKKHMKYDAARLVANFSTIKITINSEEKYSLPFGFTQSPFLSAMCLDDSQLGRLLREYSVLASSGSLNVSVYMDDIILSSNNFKYLNDAGLSILNAAKRSNFEIKDVGNAKVKQLVEVFNVNLSHRLLEITADKMQDFSMRYASSSNPNEQKGIYDYVLSVNPSQAVLL